MQPCFPQQWHEAEWPEVYRDHPTTKKSEVQSPQQRQASLTKKLKRCLLTLLLLKLVHSQLTSLSLFVSVPWCAWWQGAPGGQRIWLKILLFKLSAFCLKRKWVQRRTEREKKREIARGKAASQRSEGPQSPRLVFFYLFCFNFFSHSFIFFFPFITLSLCICVSFSFHCSYRFCFVFVLLFIESPDIQASRLYLL